MCALPIRKEHRELQPADMMRSFLLYKSACGLAERTMTDYRKILEHFFAAFPDALDFPRERTMEYLAGYSNPTSFNIRFAYLKVFWDWTTAEGYFRGERYPLDGIRKKRPRGRIVQVPESDLKRLLQQPKRSTFAGFRDFVLMSLQLDTAIRPGEALQIMPEDFSPHRKEIEIRAEVSKTRVPRIVPLSPVTSKDVERLLSMHHPLWKDAPIFCTEVGGRLKMESYAGYVKKYAAAAKVKVTPYALRHCAAILMLRGGVSAFTLAAIMGHSDLSMTKRYLAITGKDTHREHSAAGVMRMLSDEEQPPARVRKV